MAKKSKKIEEVTEDVAEQTPVNTLQEDFNRLLEYAKGLEGTIQAFRQKVEVYEAMQIQLLGDKRELKSYVSSLENTLNQARQSTQS
jgi:hypothetical protein|tara:strand:- start:4356 stop:4616 length:261 start_codon:yes stop_codon:yes gene_type:complete